MAICIDIAPKSALGKKKVVLELIFAHFRACPGLRIWHDKRVDVLPLYTDLGRKFITFSTLNFRKFTSFPSKMKQRQRFQGVFQHPEVQSIYPDISDPIFSHPDVVSYWADGELSSFISDIIPIFWYRLRSLLVDALEVEARILLRVVEAAQRVGRGRQPLGR